MHRGAVVCILAIILVYFNKGGANILKLVVGHEYKDWTSLECTQQNDESVEIKAKQPSQSRFLSGHS